MYKNWDELKEKLLQIVLEYNEEYKKRLEFELKEIDKQGANDYWLEIINASNKYDHNKNGLVLPFLLKITDIDPIKGEPKLFVNGEDLEIDGVEITLENGVVIRTSEHTMIKTKRGYIKAVDLSENDELE